MGRYYPMDSDNSAVHIARKERTMRLIDADAFKTWINEYVSVFKKSDTAEIKGYISHQPSIDICFCKECRYCKKKRSTFKGEPIIFYRCTENNRDVEADDFCSWGERNCSEKPNNCEHITEDGVTCAKYPACDDCLDNPLNKVKGSERLVKGSERSSE